MSDGGVGVPVWRGPGCPGGWGWGSGWVVLCVVKGAGAKVGSGVNEFEKIKVVVTW